MIRVNDIKLHNNKIKIQNNKIKNKIIRPW